MFEQILQQHGNWNIDQHFLKSEATNCSHLYCCYIKVTFRLTIFYMEKSGKNTGNVVVANKLEKYYWKNLWLWLKF